jgi:uncharacterized membrane protein
MATEELHARVEQATARAFEPRADGQDLRLARGLGWFSIGLGLAEVAATRPLARMIGVSDGLVSRTIMRACGLREIASGVGILMRPNAPALLEARVGGDVIDLSLLGAALIDDDSSAVRIAAATASVLGVTALDVVASERLRRRFGSALGGAGIRKSVTVNRPVEEVYRFWRHFENAPRFMRRIESVQELCDRRSRWRAKVAGATVEWESEVTEDEPNRLIAWRSVDSAPLTHAGSVRFMPAPGDRGTEVVVELSYKPPGSVFATGLAKLVGKDPVAELQEDLRAFKELLETGEIANSAGPAARRRPSLLGQGSQGGRR